MRISSSRLFGMLLLIVVVVLVLLPIAGSEVRGEDLATPIETEVAAVEVVSTEIPVVEPSVEEPVVVEQAVEILAEEVLATEIPSQPEQQAAIASTETPVPATSVPNEFPVTTPVATKETTTTVTISADLTTAVCTTNWRFSISGLSEDDAPSSIRVVFEESGVVFINLQYTQSSGFAMYYRSGMTHETVLSATASVPAGYTGVFQLDRKRCPAHPTPTPIVIAPQIPSVFTSQSPVVIAPATTTPTATGPSNPRATPTRTPTATPTRGAGVFSTPTSFSIPR